MAGSVWVGIGATVLCIGPLVALVFMAPPADDVTLYPPVLHAQGPPLRDAWTFQAMPDCLPGETGRDPFGFFLRSQEAGTTCTTVSSAITVPAFTERLSFHMTTSSFGSNAGSRPVWPPEAGGMRITADAVVGADGTPVLAKRIFERSGSTLADVLRDDYLNVTIPHGTRAVSLDVVLTITVPPDPRVDPVLQVDFTPLSVRLGPAPLAWAGLTATEADWGAAPVAVVTRAAPQVERLEVVIESPVERFEGDWRLGWIIELEQTSSRSIERVRLEDGQLVGPFDWLEVPPLHDPSGQRVRLGQDALALGGPGHHSIELGPAVATTMGLPAFTFVVLGAGVAGPVAWLTAPRDRHTNRLTDWHAHRKDLAVPMAALTVTLVVAITVAALGTMRVRVFPLDDAAVLWWVAIIAVYLAALVYWVRRQVRQRRRFGVQAAQMAEQKDIHDARAQRFEQMLHSVTHDLKTPMLTMEWLLEHVRETEGAEAQEALLETSRHLSDNVTQMKAFVEDMATLARLESDEELVADDDPVAVAPRVRAVAERLAVLARQAGTRVEPELDESVRIPGPTVLVDQVLTNLLGNAIKYGRRDDGRIRISLERTAGTVRIVVDDNGEGIPPAERARVLELFGRGDPDRHPGVSGTGVGLAIVDRIVKRWNGTLHISKSPLGGARFTIEVPEASRRDA